MPYTNEELEALIYTLPDVSENQACLKSERCAKNWLRDYNSLLSKLGERGAYLEFQNAVNITDENGKELEDFAPIANKFERITKPIVKKFLA